jgi:asparagine synthase (glutamine-hydrolysing)
MCGLGGYFSFSPANGDGPAFQLERCVQRLGHRGPDDRGIETFSVANRTAGFGHTRLSIIDLSTGGHQPMKSPDGRFSVIYNGEIYNYRELKNELRDGFEFRSESDTEVLIAAWARWGVDCLRRLTGMFAIVMVDHQKGTATLARDAFGIKPLFYCHDRTGFAFASEIQALIALTGRPAALNLQRAADYLVWGSYDDRPATMHKDIFHLPPGHWMQLQPGAPTPLREPVRWWWPSVAERKNVRFDDAAARVRELFLDSVRLHLRSDVPVGAALSGGVDSSAVVCAMRKVEPDMPIHTFSFVARGTAVDEERWADVINARTGAVVHKVEVTPDEMMTDLDDMIRAQGEPFMSTSIYAQYRVFRLAREHGIKVTLDGQGADEMLAGYAGYPGARIRSLMEQARLLRLGKFLRGWSSWPGRTMNEGLKLAVRQAIPDVLAKRMKRSPVPDWLNGDILAERGVSLRPPFELKREKDARGRRLSSALRNALAMTGLQALLRHGDRNSMRWSIESRVPFLTTSLAEYLLTLPEHYLLSDSGETKSVFRAAMRGIVPDEILDRKDKIGFATPERQWLEKIDIDRWLSADTAKRVPFLKFDSLREQVRSQIFGKTRLTPLAWRILNFCRWMELNEVAV